MEFGLACGNSRNMIWHCYDASTDSNLEIKFHARYGSSETSR